MHQRWASLSLFKYSDKPHKHLCCCLYWRVIHWVMIRQHWLLDWNVDRRCSKLTGRRLVDLSTLSRIEAEYPALTENDEIFYPYDWYLWMKTECFIEALKVEFQWFTVVYGIQCSFWGIITHECANTCVLFSRNRCTRFHKTCSTALSDIYEWKRWGLFHGNAISAMYFPLRYHGLFTPTCYKMSADHS